MRQVVLPLPTFHHHDFRVTKRVNRILIARCSCSNCKTTKTLLIKNFSPEKAKAIDELIKEGVVCDGGIPV